MGRLQVRISATKSHITLGTHREEDIPICNNLKHSPRYPQVQKHQTIAQLPALSSQWPSEASPSNPYSHALFSHLQNVLLTNTLQRDSILSAMKQIAVGDFQDSWSIPVNIAIAEKSMLEAAHEREKDLIREITELQWRLVNSQEEIQKCKTEKIQE